MVISMIAAMAKDRIIGDDNKMPWHLPADLQHFKKITLGKPVIMGRKTFESIGRPLPGRRNIVITRNAQYQAEGIETASSTEEALALVDKIDEVMIIGGGNIYKQFLPLCTKLYLTYIDLDIEGDTRFPEYTSSGNWVEVESEVHEPDDRNKYRYKFVTLNKGL
ncbi:type 3 dihydrofolate reductase [Pseudoalteromonas umbrosa]|uniref:type 3 dihydrofolate reductase n=1 Tax=Pseudoalteromonas umbrosa TaxID=3048489 RepID=UPI0024C3A556|nr:type 3 dihydrofolate reductase [Pseudoalteromonas sp. B95]MDK1288743.1 type 3 dihydrofolate reductase [Pseudoalteromonas sp. B95]